MTLSAFVFFTFFLQSIPFVVTSVVSTAKLLKFIYLCFPFYIRCHAVWSIIIRDFFLFNRILVIAAKKWEMKHRRVSSFDSAAWR